MIRRTALSVLLCLLLAGGLLAQGPQVAGTISAAGSTCTPTTCVPYQLPEGTGSIAIQTIGTFTGTLTVEGMVAGGTLASTGDTIATATITRVSVIGLTYVQVRASDLTAGSVVVYIRSSQNSLGGDVSVGDLSVIEAETTATADGIGATTDSAASVGGVGSLNAKERLASSQRDAIQTAVTEIAGATTTAGASTSGLVGNYMFGAVTSGTPNLTNGQTAPIFINTSGYVQMNIAGASGLATDAAEDAAPTSNPIPVGCRYRTSLPSVTAGDMAYVLCTAGGALQTQPTGYSVAVGWGSSVNLAVTNSALVTVSAGTRIILHEVSVNCNSNVSVAVTVSLGFGAASVPSSGSGLIIPGIVTSASAYQGIVRGTGWPNVLHYGADGEDIRLTLSAPTGGACPVMLVYSTETV